MAIPHAQPGQVVDVRPLGAGLREARTETLIKTGPIEVIRLVMPTGKEIHEHHTHQEVIIQCLEGKVSLQAHGKTEVLEAGQLVLLAPAEPHAVRAIEDASLLLTILLGRSRDGEADRQHS